MRLGQVARSHLHCQPQVTRTGRSSVPWLEVHARAWAAGGDVVGQGIEDLTTGLLCGCVRIQRDLDFLSAGPVNLTYDLYPQWRGCCYATRAVALATSVA